MKQLVIAILSITLLFTTVTLPAYAQECKPLYGGGETDQQACDGQKSVKHETTPEEKKKDEEKKPEDKKVPPTPTARPKLSPTPIKKPTPLPTKPATTKGGLPVMTPTPQKTTPPTGPEAMGLLTLIPLGALGYYLRKKA